MPVFHLREPRWTASAQGSNGRLDTMHPHGSRQFAGLDVATLLSRQIAELDWHKVDCPIPIDATSKSKIELSRAAHLRNFVDGNFRLSGCGLCMSDRIVRGSTCRGSNASNPTILREAGAVYEGSCR
jgi:hypothetical protein